MAKNVFLPPGLDLKFPKITLESEIGGLKSKVIDIQSRTKNQYYGLRASLNLISLIKQHNLFDGHQPLHIYQANDFITIPSPPLNFGNPPLIFGKVRKAAKNGQF